MTLPENLAEWRAPVSIAVLIVLLAWESLHPFFRFFSHEPQPLRRRFAHGAVNVGLGLLNALVTGFIFTGLWAATMHWAESRAFGLLHALPVSDWLRWPLALLLLDAWTYAWHRLNHVVPFFWRFHRLHHSDRQMDATTASRFHIGEIVLSSVLRVPVLALLGCRLEELALYEVALFAVVQFHHANIGLPPWLDRALRVAIVTPELHKLHHSVVVAEQNSNFSSLLSCWDRLAATLRIAPDPRRIVFGVEDQPRTGKDSA